MGMPENRVACSAVALPRGKSNYFEGLDSLYLSYLSYLDPFTLDIIATWYVRSTYLMHTVYPTQVSQAVSSFITEKWRSWRLELCSWRVAMALDASRQAAARIARKSFPTISHILDRVLA